MSFAQVTAQPLALRTFTTDQAAASRALGNGLQLAFRVGDESATLVFEGLPAALTGASHGSALQSDLGTFWLTEASAVLSLFGDTPVIIDGEPQGWYWQLFNQGVSPALREVFGELRPLPPELLPVDDHICCRVVITRNGERLVTQLSASSITLLHLFAHPALRPLEARTPRPMPLLVPLKFPLLLGAVRMTLATVRSLRPGDVVLMPEASFDCTGNGTLQLGPLHCQGELSNDGDDVHFTVHDLEERPMNDYDHVTDPVGAEPAWGAPAEDAYGPPGDEDDLPADDFGQAPGFDTQAQAETDTDLGLEAPLPDAFGDLPLDLTVRSGTLRLTLKQLQRLAPGSVLEIPGVKPGAATLYYGERAVAEGELVEVDGRLGLQILRMELV